VVILVTALLVDSFMEDFTPQEREDNGGSPGDEGSPHESGITRDVLLRDDSCNDEGLDGQLGQHYCHPGQFSEELLVGHLDYRVQRPAGPDVLGEVFPVDAALGDGIREEIDQPVKEEDEPDEPDSNDVLETVLELTKTHVTSPPMVEA
jgi:hypothetical protein